MNNAYKNIYGALALRLFPKQVKSLKEGNSLPETKLDRLLFDALTNKAAKSGEFEVLREQLSNYWKSSAGDLFFENYTDRFQENFLSEHYSLVTALKSHILSRPLEYNRLVEIGCGNGEVLNHLQGEFPAIGQFTGIDINKGIISRNRDFYQSDNMEFVAGDAVNWFRQPRGSGIVLFSYGGVMEYLLESELREIFTTLKKRDAPAVVALCEPLYDDFDTEKEKESRSGGTENSFSHNHAHLLEDSGFTVLFNEELQGEFRWKLVLAVTETHP